MQCRASLHHDHGLLLLAGGKKRRFETPFFDIANGDFKSFSSTFGPLTRIGNVHDASQCADSDDRFPLDSPGNCCGLLVDDRQCHNGYTVSSVSFEECQKTNERCSFTNSCFSCVLSPPGKDSPHPTPFPLHESTPHYTLLDLSLPNTRILLDLVLALIASFAL
jgi:hypothetical protein